MQTSLADFIKDTRSGREADAILRKCVHCGFCTATCPTYQLLGDELDGPRGRIYLIKQVLEGKTPTHRTQLHLDRCLTCRSCETTCPSGVRYGRLVDIGREVVDQQVGRRAVDGAVRRLLRWILPYPKRFGAVLALGRALRPLMPGRMRKKVPVLRPPGDWPRGHHRRRVLLVRGCVQGAIAPIINAATARVLNGLGIGAVEFTGAGCCGAVSYHLSAHEEGLDFMRRNIDAWWASVESGVEAIVSTASACTAMIKEYGELLADDPDYGAKAARVSAMTRDLSELLAAEDLPKPNGDPAPPIAFHAPCTLQHGQGINGTVEGILSRAGFTLTGVPDAHLCCGSAGTYSLLQPELSHRLLENKLDALYAGNPAVIVTANIGCLAHLQTNSRIPVRHWIELLDPAVSPAP